VYGAAARHLNASLAEGGGKVRWESGKELYELVIKPNDVAQAIDVARTLTRDIWRSRRLAKHPNLAAEPTAEELSASMSHMLSLRSRYQHAPIGMTVYACDNERGGRSFGTKEEIDFWNKANNFHGIGNLQGPIRHQQQFVERIEKTAPVLTKNGDLLFGCGFNGHGAPGGQGMSMLSDGSTRLSSSLMSGVSIAKALEEHCANHRDVYLKQADSPKSAYVGIYIFCCFSQDQMRNNGQGPDAGAGNDVLSRLETLTSQYKIRFCVFTESETMKPGYYQPGTNIPALGPRALARATNHKQGNLEIGDIYDSIGFGGEGVHSNPSLFVTDRRKPAMFQVV
jgi:hypothetical protein